MPHFFVDDEFSDSKEVMAIPARHRLAAIGLWTLAGSWSANKLLDGYVFDNQLKSLGARKILIDALCDIRGPDGENWALWERTSDGIRFTNWAKWQRTRAQVVSYRAAQADKKRKAREAAKNATASNDTKMSPGDSPGEYPDLSPGESRVPIPIPKPVPKYLSTSGGSVTSVAPPEPEPDDAESATPGAELVRRIIPREHPDAVKLMLRIRATELIGGGTPTETVAAALELWLTKPHLGPNVLPSLVSEVIRNRDQPTPNGKSKNKLRTTAELAQRMRDEENQAQRKELA